MNDSGRFQVDSVREDGNEEVDRSRKTSHWDDEAGRSRKNSQFTYMPQYDKTLGQLTREALPKLDNYRALDSLHAVYRPTLDELHNKTFHERPKKVAEDEDQPALKGKVIKFSWLEGVLMRCLLSIWGVMLFLRLSWVVGQAGVTQGILLMSLANLVTFITAFSMSAVSTNGQIKGGGIYYMISRSLGPEFGGAIGLMFTTANSVAVAVYIVGFCESLQDLLKANDWGQIIDGGVNDIRVVGLGVLIAILILVFVGMDWVTRTQMFLLVILIAAQVNFVVGSIIGPVSDDERAKGFTGYKLETWERNVEADYREGYGDDHSQQDFFSVFGVFFPAVTGIVAGANLSGDLKDPASAIPKGTLLAILITYVSYIGYGFMMGGCVVREASGDVDAYRNATDPYEFYDSCSYSNTTCNYGLLWNAQVMELVSSWGPLIYMGCFAATLSSAIASLVGAPRVFQALAKDQLYPLIGYFGKGHGANNDPYRGYILVFFISFGCLMIAKLNALAPLQSNFFLAAYCLINFSVFHASITKSPGWRPAFKYYNAWVSLLGAILCVAVMFLMSWVTALITVGVTITLYLYVQYRKPDVNWGSSTQAQSYNSALKSVQDLNSVEEHVKNYRPQVLVLSGMPSARPPLIDFSNLLVKNLSLLICGHVVKDHVNHKVRSALNRQAYDWLEKHKKKAFYTLVEEENFERGARGLMQISGIGKLRPNLVMMGYKRDWLTCDRQELLQYFNVIHEALDMHLAVGMLRVQEGLDYSKVIKEEDQMTPEQLVEMTTKQHGKFDRNLSVESQLSQDEVSADEISPPASPMPERPDVSSPTPSKKRGRKASSSSKYTGPDGAPLPPEVLSSVTQFQKKQKKGTIDVWWLYDDGGLTLLLPYILSTRSQYAGCKLRVFCLTSRKYDLGMEQRNMAALLAKFRIDFSDVIVIPTVTEKAKDATKKEFQKLIAPFKSDDDEAPEGTVIQSHELVALREKTNRNLRLRELLLQHSKEATLIVMTLPVPRKGTVSAPLYMAWLEMITKGMPPFLFVRGNQTSVLSFYM